MSVTDDAFADAGNHNSTASYSWTHTVGSGLSNSALYVMLGGFFGVQSVNSVQIDGVNMTQVFASSKSPSGDQVFLYRKLLPASGSRTLTVNLSGATDSAAWSASFSGVDQTTPERATGTAIDSSAGNTASVSVSGALAGDAAVDIVAMSDGTKTISMVAHTNRVQEMNHSGVGVNEGTAGSKIDSPANPQTFDWTWIGFSLDWSIGAAILKASGGGGATTQFVSWITD